MNSLTAIAAAVTSAAQANASAGIFNYNISNTPPAKAIIKTNSTGDSQHIQECYSEAHHHQIGTNLADLSVCWHKVTLPDNCQFCGHPFYEANQFLCHNCNGTTNNEKILLEEDLSIFEKIMPKDEDLNLMATLNDTSKDETAAKFSFELEFSSLILNSNLSTAVDSLLLKHSQSLPKLSDQIDLISSHTTKSNNSICPFSSRDLIEQIHLFNKYNRSKLTELKYELVDSDHQIKIFGVLKIHWNLKQPIKIPINRNNVATSYKQDSFTATAVKDLNKGKKSFDDSSPLLKDNPKERSTLSSRSHTVKCKPNKWKRTPISNVIKVSEDQLKSGNAREEENEECQMFIPSYGSMSSICIESKTSCESAIQILLDKFHISNSASEYSLYKVYQTGDKRELSDSDFPLIQRLWMGPFDEDKFFIMEKGRQLNMTQDLQNLMGLPDTLLNGLIQQSKQEELKETNNLKTKYSNYSKALKEHCRQE
jgi:Ras association domain-containing protein 2/4